MSEGDKRFPVGPRGVQGKQGERGERGLSRLQGRAVVFLFGLAVVLAALSLLWNSHQVNANAAAQRSQQASQQRQGELLEQKLCTSLNRLAALNPPPGPAADNPSRAYLQSQHDVLAQLGPDVGCKGN